jgi:hypothetical protein
MDTWLKYVVVVGIAISIRWLVTLINQLIVSAMCYQLKLPKPVTLHTEIQGKSMSTDRVLHALSNLAAVARPKELCYTCHGFNRDTEGEYPICPPLKKFYLMPMLAFITHL